MNRIIVLIALLLLSSINSFGQKWDDLNTEAIEIFKKGEIDRAIPIAEKAVDAAKREFGENDSNYILSMSNLAYIYARSKYPEKAEPYLLKIVEIQKTTLGDTSEAYVDNLGALGDFYSKMEKFDKAEAVFLDLQQILKNVIGEETLGYAMALKKLQDIYFLSGDHKRSSQSGEGVLKILKKLLGEYDPVCIPIAEETGTSYELIKDYRGAGKIFLYLKLGKEKSDSTNTSGYAHALYHLGICYENLKQYPKTIFLYTNAKELISKLHGEYNEEYAGVVNSLSLLYYNSGDYKNAEPLSTKAVEIRKKLAGDKDPAYALSLNNLGNLYRKLGVFDKAEQNLTEAIMVSQNYKLQDPSDYIIMSNNLGLLYSDMGRYEKAEPLYLESNKYTKQYIKETDPIYTYSFNGLAALYLAMGQYERAESLFILVRGIRENVFGKISPEYAIIIDNIALLYTKMARYKEAELLNLEALSIWEKTRGIGDPDYLISLNNLAQLYSSMGQYDKAEPILLRAKELKRIAFGETRTEYAVGLSNLASLYKTLGQYDKAEPLLMNAEKIIIQSIGEENPLYATCIENLASVMAATNRYIDALPLYIKAKDIRKRTQGETHPDYAISLINLGDIYNLAGLQDKAEQTYLDAVQIMKTSVGEDHPDYAFCLERLANFYTTNGQYKKAETYLSQAIMIDRKTLGVSHPDYAVSLAAMAALYMNMGTYEKAEPLLIEYNVAIQDAVIKLFSVLSENEKSNYQRTNIGVLSSNANLLYYNKNSSASMRQSSMKAQLFFKSVLLSDTKSLLDILRNRNDTATNRLFTEWKNGKALLAKQYSLPANKRMKNIRDIEMQTEQMEKTLNTRSSAIRNGQDQLRVSIKDVQSKLRDDEATIEFIRFRLYGSRVTDSFFYAAYILRKNDEAPQFVPLCEEAQLGNYFMPGAGDAIIKAIYRSDPVDENDKPGLSGENLYTLIWKPLLPYLKGINKIDYSPAGLLYKIAFHALPAGDSQLLMDKYELNQFISTRQVALSDEKKSADNSLAIFGNCLYSMDSAAIVRATPANRNAATIVPPNRFNVESQGGWKPLAGAANEVASINALFEKSKIISSSYTLESATEEQFKSLSGHSPSIIHLATHGFFLQDPVKKKQQGFAADERNVFTLADDPLIRSGIVLSGANRAWNGKQPVEGREDGIVTAYEIAQMDLSKTELVVLSACQTALGDIKGSEGVFGLQRAFKQAGVKKMILSLWKVPDQETGELMNIFYSNYLQGKTARESLVIAQKEMRKKYRPYYWAAFVLIE